VPNFKKSTSFIRFSGLAKESTCGGQASYPQRMWGRVYEVAFDISDKVERTASKYTSADKLVLAKLDMP
jgi:hypothetical protein